MGLLQRTRIKTRLALSFALLVALFVVFGVFSILEMNKLGELTWTLYNHPLRVSNRALKSSSGVIKMHRNMKDISLSKSDLELNKAIQAVRFEENLVYGHLDVVGKQILGAEGKALERETREAFADWKPIRDEVIGLMLKGERDAAAQITRKKGANYVSHLERKMMELTKYARSKADGFMKNAKNAQGQTVRNTLIFIALVAAFSVAVAYLLISNILSSLSALGDTMSEITKTGELVKSDLSGNDEITEMSRHFNLLVEKLQDQFWLRNGRNSLNDEISGGLSYDDLATKSLNFVSRYVEACSGALYSYNRETSLCDLKASFAFVERKYLSNQFKKGEGIVGQVAVEKKPSC